MNIHTLNKIDKGFTSEVIDINDECINKQRLLDMGFSVGTDVKVIWKGNGITAYQVKGTILALRYKDAGYINVLPK